MIDKQVVKLVLLASLFASGTLRFKTTRRRDGKTQETGRNARKSHLSRIREKRNKTTMILLCAFHIITPQHVYPILDMYHVCVILK